MPEESALQAIIIALNAGILALLLSERLRLPGIIFYLVLGVLLGPFFLNWVIPKSLGSLLPVIIELGVALIMFEGAMNLNISQYKSASGAIRSLLTLGLIISVISIMMLTHWLFAWPWGICLLFGVLMSVTGPTVISPILRKVPLKEPLGSILHWESILLEPIIVVGSILIVEFLIQTEITLVDTLIRLLKIFLVGGTIGSIAGWALSYTIKRRPPKQEELRNILMLGMALLIFEVSNVLSPDSGLVAVVFSGLIIGNSSIPTLYEIKQFKELITRVMISFLFILLAANLDWNLLIKFSVPVIFLLIAIMFVVRPLVVFLSLGGTRLTQNSKLFLSLTAPRGIVAASMASLLTIVFARQGSDQATQFEILAYQVIFITVFTQALWSKPLAKILKVSEVEKRGYLVIGAHPLALGIASWLKEKGIKVALIDRDSYDVYLAKKRGLLAFKGDALNEYFLDELPLGGVGNLLALTSNDEVNTLACQLGKRYFGQDRTYQIHKSLKEKEEGFLKMAGGKLVFPNLPPLLSLLDGLGRGDYKFREGKGTPPETFLPLMAQKGPEKIGPVTDHFDFEEDTIYFGLEKKDSIS